MPGPTVNQSATGPATAWDALLAAVAAVGGPAAPGRPAGRTRRARPVGSHRSDLVAAAADRASGIDIPCPVQEPAPAHSRQGGRGAGRLEPPLPPPLRGADR